MGTEGLPGSQIFISYRRSDTAHAAGRLFELLQTEFGAANVFMDVDSIDAGVDFAEAIEQAVSACAVLFALIGPGWIDTTDEHGRRRLDDPDDVVALEVATALRRGTCVIPVLVDGASMPRRTEIPDALASLLRRQCLRLDHDSFRKGVTAVISAVRPVLADRELQQKHAIRAGATGPILVTGADKQTTILSSPPKAPRGFLSRRTVVGIAFASALVLVSGLGVFMWNTSPLQDGGPPSVVYDPYQYIGIRQQAVSRQSCIGMIGLCLGQSIDPALATFGQEAGGYPDPETSSRSNRADMCHAWSSNKVPFLKICSLRNAITSIYVSFSGESELDVALPGDFHASFPAPMTYEAKEITSKLQSEPFSSSWGLEEGGSGASYSWFFPARTDGGPEEAIIVNGDYGRIPVGPDRRQACSFISRSTRELDSTTFPYQVVQNLTVDMPVTSLEVRLVTDEDKTFAAAPDVNGCRPNA